MKHKPNKINTLRVRLTDHEHWKLEAFAARHGQTISHVIREYIRRLPLPSQQQLPSNPDAALKNIPEQSEGRAE